MIDREVVFIADRVQNHNDANLNSYDLEKIADDYFKQMWDSLNTCSFSVVHYESPKQFLSNIEDHKNSLVFSLWSGETFRSRRAIVPSICEAYCIPYVGADPYIQTVCADKHLSKQLCSRYNINSANDVIISSTCDFSLLKKLKYPAVVKPNFEGGSIGIFNKNLVDSYEEATQICSDLLPFYRQLLVEEYIPGEEVSICIAGIGNDIDVFQVTRVSIDGKTYFDHDILGAESKKMKQTSNRRDIVTSIFPRSEKENMLSLFKSLGKVEYMRIDGRINNGVFTLIELTPDCSLSPTSSMLRAFQATGYDSHADMIAKLCTNSLKNLKEEYQNANK